MRLNLRCCAVGWRQVCRYASRHAQPREWILYLPCSVASSATSAKSLSGPRDDRFKPGRDISFQMEPEYPPSALCEDVKVAAGLRGFDHAEAVATTRNGQIGPAFCRYLQEHTRVRAAFVGLTRGVQEPRTEAETGRDPFGVAQCEASLLKNFSVR